MTPLRLAYLTTDPGIPPDSTKGASIHFRELARSLCHQGVEVDPFMNRRCVSSSPHAAFERLPVTLLPGAKRRPGAEGELRLLGAQARCLEAVRESGPHEAVYERFSLFGLTGLTYARREGIPFILEVNAPLWAESERYRSLELKHVALAAAREALSGADRVLAVSETLAELLVGEGVEPERVVVFRNGVNGDLFSTPNRVNRPESLADKTTLLFVGSLKPWHGLEFLLDAFRRARATRRLGLWIVGDGPLRGAVEACVEEFGEDLVYQSGLPHEEIPAVLRAADIAVVPYHRSSPDYFCPLKVIEALAAGTPVLASDKPSVREFVDAGFKMDLFRPDDVDSFAAALDTVCAKLPERRNRAEAMRRLALSEFTWDARAREIVRLIGATAAARRPAEEVAT